jgi:uncharacterized protein (UPF0276 family)
MVMMNTKARGEYPLFPTPTNTGVGLKAEHYDWILEHQPDVGFFELHAENYLAPGGPHRHYLNQIRHHYPITIHGVGLSIGSTLNHEHLKRVAALVEQMEPLHFSEHLAWSTHDNHYFNDLLPLAYNEETLQRVCEHIDIIQHTMQRQILIENPATYLRFSHNTMSEIDFIQQMSQRTGCALLLDVNNVAVSAFNHQFSALNYLDEFPLQKVKQLHLAGHYHDTQSQPQLKIDSHDRVVSDDVWALYKAVIPNIPSPLTLIEWDNAVPGFSILAQQAKLADSARQLATSQERLRHVS